MSRESHQFEILIEALRPVAEAMEATLTVISRLMVPSISQFKKYVDEFDDPNCDDKHAVVVAKMREVLAK